MSSVPESDDPDASYSGLWPRLLLFPAVVGLLFIGGVYWLRVQLDRSGGQPEASAVVEVQLLPRPDPLPIPVSPAQQSADSAIAAPVKTSTETPADLPREVLASLPTEERPILEPAVSTKTSLPSVDAVPNAAMMQFRADLLHHIAKFQRYPRSAEPKRLQGTVHAVFSIDRDGKLLGAWVKSSSGQIMLDQAAIDTIRRAQPMPHIPSNLPNSVKVEVALGFDPP